VFGVAIMAAVFAAHGSYASPAAFVAGFRPAEWVAAAVAATGVIGAALAPSRRQLAVPQHTAGLVHAVRSDIGR
jgi:hypothetical protein